MRVRSFGVLAVTLSAPLGLGVGATDRSYNFHAKPSVLPLSDQLQFTHTQLYGVWPKRLTMLPRTINAATISTNDEPVLMGPPIHVEAGDRLKVNVTNGLSYSGLSIHMHGFGGEFLTAGAIGVSQCALSEGDSQTIDIPVTAAPGSYWYHTTQSGHLGIDAIDLIRGPLIVHPPGTMAQFGNNLALAYGDERVLFFQDASLQPSKLRYAQLIGGVKGPVVKDGNGFVVSSVPFDYGTCNGKLREVIYVNRNNRRYKFRLIHGGTHHALRIRIDNFSMTVIAVDSEEVKPYPVDELVLHVGERVDVYIDVYDDLFNGESFWIRADTLEPTSQGFTNGIRAILHLTDANLEVDQPKDSDIDDPMANIQSISRSGTRTLNCHGGINSGCIPITSLVPKNRPVFGAFEENNLEADLHTVDLHHTPAPQYAHFVRVDGSHFTQAVLPNIALSDHTAQYYDPHPHTVILDLSRTRPSIIVWRSTLLVDTPFRIHGHKVEILDIVYPSIESDCTLKDCKLSEVGSSRMRVLNKVPLNSSIKKDSFIIPAGGAIVTRFVSNNRGLWLATGNMDTHSEDGFSFVINVGNYPVRPSEELLLPISGLPSCETSFVTSMETNPDCECYVDDDAPLRSQIAMEKTFCSRPHLCGHKVSQQANLESFKFSGGIHMKSDLLHLTQDAVTAIFLTVIVLNILLVMCLYPNRTHNLPIFESLGGSKKEDRQKRRSSIIDVRLNNSSLRNIGTSRRSHDSMGSGNNSRHNVGHSRSMDSNSNRSRLRSLELMDSDFSDEISFSDMTSLPLPPPPPRGNGTKSPDDEADFQFRSSRARQLVDDLFEEQSTQRSQVEPSPYWRRLSAISNRSSIVFNRVFSHRDDIDAPIQGFDFLPDGFQVEGKIDLRFEDQEKVSIKSSYYLQIRYLLREQILSYSCNNLTRLIEVVGIACIMGTLFGKSESGSGASANMLSKVDELVMLSSLYWTWARMYTAVISHHEWFRNAGCILRYKRFSLAPVFIARIVTVLLSECLWPTIYCFICFPLAGFVGDVKILSMISFILASNNICYISLGALFGTLASNAQYGMTSATVITQGTILAAGVFTSLPSSLEWARMLSPFYWTLQGMLKSVFRWSDSYSCVQGSSSDLPPNQCFIEFNPIIDRYKRRGISAATYNDSTSEDVFTESIALVVLSYIIQTALFLRCFFCYVQN